MAERTGEQAVLRSALVYAANDTYYACTNEIKSNHGADRLRLTVTNTVADAGNVTFKVELNQGGTYSVLASDISTTAFVATNVKSIVLPVRFCANDVVRVSFKASAGATSAKIAIEGLFYLSSDASSENLVQEFTTVADTVLSLTEDYPETIVVSGSASGYTVRTPPATSLPVGWTRRIKNVSSEFIIIDNGATPTLFEFLEPGATLELTLSVASAAGTWSCQKSKSCRVQYLEDDFQDGSTTVWQKLSGGTGASSTYGSSAVRCNAGTTTTGYNAVSRSAYSQRKQLTVQAMMFQSLIGSISNNADGTDDYWIDVAQGTANSNLEHTAGFGFRLIFATTGNNNWHAMVVNSSTPTYVDTGVALIATAQNTALTAIRNSAGTRLDYYINKARVAVFESPTTTIPAVPAGPCYRIIKTAGTSNRYFDVDTYRTLYVYAEGTQV